MKFDPLTDYYGILGLPRSASPADIRAAYRRLAKGSHPDLHAGSSVAVARMARLNQAKTVLLHPSTRAAYDAARQDQQSTSARLPHRGRVATGIPTRPPASTVATSGHRRTARGGGFDRTTVIFFALVLLLAGGIAYYVVDAVQVASRPARRATTDLALAPNAVPSWENASRTAFLLVGGRPLSGPAARSANQVILGLRDASPEAEVLRSVGRRLVLAAEVGDQAAWDEAIAVLCTLAVHC